jgi:predicted amidohydrolase
VQGLQAIARELGVVVSAGVHELPEKHEDSAEPAGSTRVFNTHVLIGADGGVLEKYRKLHLFDVELESESDGRTLRTGESRRIIPGPGIVPPVDVPGLGKVGLEICYDLRFPELQVVLTRMGAQVLTFPSAFTLRTGKDHWRESSVWASVPVDSLRALRLVGCAF